MRWEDVYIDATGVRLGRLEDVREAVDEGRYDAEECKTDDFVSVSVVEDASYADMAVDAAQVALSRTHAAHEDFCLVAHATSFAFQGLDHWISAPYIQARTVGGRASAVQLEQASNGSMAAMDLAASYVAARPAPSAALITTSEKYQLPMFDRYRSDKNGPKGDGATAMVLTRGSGVARLLATAVFSDTTHEGVYRGTRPWTDSWGEYGWPVSMRKRLKEYLSTGVNVQDVAQSIGAGREGAMLQAMDEAGVGLQDIARFVFPFSGRSMVDWEAAKEKAGLDITDTTWEYGRRLGHLGPGDQIAGLSHLLETGAVVPGDKVMLVGVGAGFSFGCAVVEVVAQPQWT